MTEFTEYCGYCMKPVKKLGDCGCANALNELYYGDWRGDPNMPPVKIPLGAVLDMTAPNGWRMPNEPKPKDCL